jgi:hypothetical protein
MPKIRMQIKMDKNEQNKKKKLKLNAICNGQFLDHLVFFFLN